MLWAEEGNTMAEGTGEKAQTRRRGKVPLLGRGRWMAMGNSLHQNVHSSEAGWLWSGYGRRKASCSFVGDWALLVQATGGQAPLVWAKGIRGLSATWCLLHELQGTGTDCGSHLRGQREAQFATSGGLGVGSTCDPNHLRGWQKRKEGTATKHHMLMLSLP